MANAKTYHGSLNGRDSSVPGGRTIVKRRRSGTTIIFVNGDYHEAPSTASPPVETSPQVKAIREASYLETCAYRMYLALTKFGANGQGLVSQKDAYMMVKSTFPALWRKSCSVDGECVKKRFARHEAALKDAIVRENNDIAMEQRKLEVLARTRKRGARG